MTIMGKRLGTIALAVVAAVIVTGITVVVRNPSLPEQVPATRTDDKVAKELSRAMTFTSPRKARP